MEIIDLTHSINNDMPVYPGTEQPELKEIFTHEQNGFREHKITLFSHIGTHIDAPAHMIRGAATLETLDINMFCGSACMIDLSHKNEYDRSICIDDLALFEEEINQSEFILLNTGWYKNWGNNKYFKDYPGLTPEAARWLIDFDLKGIGVDVISIDIPEEKDFIVHNILLETGMILIENLTNLDSLPKNDFMISCLPLKYENSDGSPVRAVAMCNA